MAGKIKQIICWLAFIIACGLPASALTPTAPENRVWEIFSTEYDAPIAEVTYLGSRAETSTPDYDTAPIHRAITDEIPTEANRSLFGPNAEFKAAEGGGLYSTIGGQGMDPALFSRIQTAFESKPGSLGGARTMESSPLSEQYLGPDTNIEGETLSQDVIALRVNPSTSSVYEELIHTAQLRRGMTVANDRVQMEIEAAQKLIKFTDQYHIPPAETQATIARLKALQGQNP